MKANIWYLLTPGNDASIGPLEYQEVINLMRSGEINGQTLAWTPNYKANQWHQIKHHLDFFDYFKDGGEQKLSHYNVFDVPLSLKRDMHEFRLAFKRSFILLLSIVANSIFHFIKFPFVAIINMANVFLKRMTNGQLFTSQRTNNFSSWYDAYVMAPTQKSIPKRQKRYLVRGDIQILAGDKSTMVNKVVISINGAYVIMRNSNIFFKQGVYVKLQVPLPGQNNQVCDVDGFIKAEQNDEGQKGMILRFEKGHMEKVYSFIHKLESTSATI